MNDSLILPGAALAAILVPVLAAWLLQRTAPNMHPAVTAVLVTVLLVVLEIIVIGVGVLRALGSITEATPNPVSGPGSYAATLLILGVPLIMRTAVLGFPAALVAAFRTRKRPPE